MRSCTRALTLILLLGTACSGRVRAPGTTDAGDSGCRNSTYSLSNFCFPSLVKVEAPFRFELVPSCQPKTTITCDISREGSHIRVRLLETDCADADTPRTLECQLPKASVCELPRLPAGDYLVDIEGAPEMGPATTRPPIAHRTLRVGGEIAAAQPSTCFAERDPNGCEPGFGDCMKDEACDVGYAPVLGKSCAVSNGYCCAMAGHP